MKKNLAKMGLLLPLLQKLLISRLVLLLACVAFIPNFSYASHGLGFEVTYECTGNPNEYKVIGKFYRDCDGIGAPNNFDIAISSQSCGISMSASLSQISLNDISNLCPGELSNCSGGTVDGVQEAIYEGLITLPTLCNDYVLGYSGCCRNSAITSINAPGSTGYNVQALLDNTLSSCNNSPVFTIPASFNGCVGQKVTYDHGVMDPDGDQLKFSFTSCLSGTGSQVTYQSGFSGANPVSTTAAGGITIDQNTGAICFTPDQEQVAVICVKVEEFRNGVKIGEVVRDIQFNVSDCTNSSGVANGVPVLTDPNNFCYIGAIGTQVCIPFTAMDTPSSDGSTDNISISTPVTFGTFSQTMFCYTPTTGGTITIPVTIVDDFCSIPGTGTYTFTIKTPCPDPVVGPASDYEVGVVNSTCSTFGGTPTGGSISPVTTPCPAGATIRYSLDGIIYGANLPQYDQDNPITIYARCECNSTVVGPVGSVTTVPGACPTCPILTANAPVAIVAAESTCSTFGGTPAGGTIAAPTTSCPTGSTLMYSIDGTNFTTTLPTYDPTTAVTVTTRCDCDGGTDMSPTSSITTVPGLCPDCPILTGNAPLAIVSAESICSTFGGTPAGGSIAAPSTSCPIGSTLMYSIDGTNFTTTLPTYDPTTAVTVTTRCDCDGGTDMSPTSSVTTVPGACPPITPLAVDDLFVTDPCSCNNPNNIVNTTGLVELFHDVLTVTTTPNVTVSLSATDNNLLDVNGNPIPVGTAIPQTSPGVYKLVFYTLPGQAATVMVSNRVSTASFVTASCTACSATIPTMSQWGSMIFGLLILNLSLVFVGRLELA